jgi:hypothetical protein
MGMGAVVIKLPDSLQVHVFVSKIIICVRSYWTQDETLTLAS